MSWLCPPCTSDPTTAHPAAAPREKEAESGVPRHLPAKSCEGAKRGWPHRDARAQKGGPGGPRIVVLPARPVPTLRAGPLCAPGPPRPRSSTRTRAPLRPRGAPERVGDPGTRVLAESEPTTALGDGVAHGGRLPRHAGLVPATGPQRAARPKADARLLRPGRQGSAEGRREGGARAGDRSGDARGHLAQWPRPHGGRFS